MKNLQNKKIAILMLACKDYEATELSLACHMSYGNPDIPFLFFKTVVVVMMQKEHCR